MGETKQKKKEKKEGDQTQAQSQLTYDPNDSDPHRRRRQFAVPGGEQPKRDDEERSCEVDKRKSRLASQLARKYLRDKDAKLGVS